MGFDPGIADLPQPSPPAAHYGMGIFDATAAPDVSDDSTAGYSAGSLWYDATGVALYICVDPAPGAAVWKQVTLT